MVQYELIRSDRKTIAIQLKKDASIVVRAPFEMTNTDIESFVKSKESWIAKHLGTITENAAGKSAFTVNYGDELLLCGKSYTIIEKPGRRAGFDGEHFYLPPGFSPDAVKQTLIKAYRQIARQVITAKVDYFSKMMGLFPSSVKINDAKTRWGSCSGKNALNFSWRLIMAREDAIDYVVVHELAHIKEHNHSARFWKLVDSVMPGYGRQKQLLKDLQHKLAKEDWDGE